MLEIGFSNIHTEPQAVINSRRKAHLKGKRREKVSYKTPFQTTFPHQTTSKRLQVSISQPRLPANKLDLLTDGCEGSPMGCKAFRIEVPALTTTKELHTRPTRATILSYFDSKMALIASLSWFKHVPNFNNGSSIWITHTLRKTKNTSGTWAQETSFAG